MAGGCDKWIVVSVLEFCFAVACLVTKAVTDDEAARLFVYLRKFSQEWSLLNNITWDRVGSSAADAVYGGYVIITAGLLLGRIVRDIPTTRRITELFLLGIGALLFVILAGLEFAALDSVPNSLIDNAAVLGSLSLITALLFLTDMAGPKKKKTSSHSQTPMRVELKQSPMEMFELQGANTTTKQKDETDSKNGKKSGEVNGSSNGYTKMKDAPKTTTFDIYGRDVREGDESDPQSRPISVISAERQQLSPVFSRSRRPFYARFTTISPKYLLPTRDTEAQVPEDHTDPGYVHYAARRWDERSTTKSSRNTPTNV